MKIVPLTAVFPLPPSLKQSEMAALCAPRVFPGNGATAERPYPGPSLGSLEEIPWQTIQGEGRWGCFSSRTLLHGALSPSQATSGRAGFSEVLRTYFGPDAALHRNKAHSCGSELMPQCARQDTPVSEQTQRGG